MNLRRRMENDLESDLREHIEMETRENIERGMSPEDARFAALRKFGNVARIAEETRAVWRWMWAERLLQDTRYALRGLRRNPVFTAVAILTLALGIGMNTAVFSVVSAVLIKPLPYPDPGRLVWLATYNQRFRFEAASAPDFTDWHTQAQSYEEMAGYLTLDSTVMDGDQSAKHAFVSTTPGFWRIAGARAALGRLFSDADRNVAVLTWRIFQQRFGGDPHVLGRVVLVDGQPTTIIGVLPQDFRFLPPPGGPGGMTGEAEAFKPNILSPELWGRRSGSIFIMFVVAKLKPAVSAGQALAELQTIQARVLREYPAMRAFYASRAPLVVPLQQKLVGESRRALVILICAVAFVLLIACANLGNLLLARASARQKEIAIRTAIGAGRGRLLRHFLVEGLTLALLGGAVGLAVAWAADALLLRVNPAAIPRLGEIAIDWRVLLFTLAISVVSGTIFGLAPLLSLSSGSLYPVLKEGGRAASAGPLGLRVRRLLVCGELALALVLLTGTGLMVRSFWRMNAHPASFEPEKIAVMKVWLSGPAYREKAPATAYAGRLLEGLSRFPGVSAAAVTNAANGVIEGLPRLGPGREPLAVCRMASAGYPKVVGIPLRRGRWTTDEEAAPAVMVNETFARRFFGEDEPLGQRINIMGPQAATIVGVVGDLKMSRLDADPEPEVLIPYRQATIFRRVEILVKTDNPAAITPGVRKLVQGLDRSQPPYGVTTLEEALAESIAPRRFNLLLLGTFAGGAVLLAMIGIYGLISYAVTQRTHEIGVRMALGARRIEVVRMVVREGMLLALTGVLAGMLAALGLTRAMATLLFEVQPNDPPTFVAVAVALTITALLASWLPALRAARVDPLTALRYE